MAAKIKLMLFSLCTYSEILSSDSKNYDSTSSSVTIFNAYISREISAKINFGIEPREMIGQIDYGKHKKVFLNTKNRDYIIQFIRPPKGDVLEDFTTYGYLTGTDPNIDDNRDSLIIITKSVQGRPLVRATSFPKVKDGLSRLYFFNGMQDTHQPGRGVYVYGLYNRLNYDGSRSRSIIQLTNDVPFGEGRESTLLPDTTMIIKAFHQVIENVPEFDEGPVPLSSGTLLEAQSGVYNYIILFGSYKNTGEPPSITVLNQISNKSSLVHIYMGLIIVSSILSLN